MLYLEIKIFFHKLVDLEKKLVTFPLFNFCLYISKNDPWIEKNCALAKMEILFAYHMHDHMINESADLVGEIPSP